MANKNSTLKTILISGILLLVLTSYVSAFAVSSRYYEGNPLYVSPGETKTFQLILQNSGEDDVQVTAELTKSQDIIRFTDSSNIYTIIPGERTPVNFEINVPSDAELEQVYPFSTRFTTLSTKDAGAVGIGSSIGQNFDIVVGQPQKPTEEIQESPVTESPYKWIIYILIAIVIIFIIILFIKKKKKQESNKF